MGMFQEVQREPLPPAADKYKEPKLKLLLGLCRRLQRASGSQPFFLSCRTAGKLLEVDHLRAWRWLFLLVHNRDLEQVEKGDRAKRRASRYRYVAD